MTRVIFIQGVQINVEKGIEMKIQIRLPAVVSILIILINASCSLSTTPPTSTPTLVPTNTFLPTKTDTPTPTNEPTRTPQPTATEIPSTATAVPMNLPAINDQYEVKIVYASFFSNITSGGYVYTPIGSGGKFLDVGVVIKNLQPGTTLNISWKDIYIIDKNNDGWYPNFGGSFAANNNDEFDPATLFLFHYDNLKSLVFDEYPLYIRGVWATDGNRPATFLFGFDTSNLVEIVIP